MHSLVGIAIKTAVLGLALFALVACETPEERAARESQHNGKSVAQMNAIFGPPVQKSATHAVWAQHNSFVVRHPIYDYYGGVSVIVGYDNQVVNQFCELTAQISQGIVVASSVDGTGCRNMVP